ncbi:hypothetical protein C8R46DRAFT_1145038 [Mycena filopes]|nr:hypothetical protein C8R46DRAFT_1145038 [Mycena filopes]
MPPEGSFSQFLLDGTQEDCSFPVTDFSAFSVFNTPAPSQYGVPFDARIASDIDEFPASPFQPLRVTTAQLNSANERFEAANEHAEIVLSVNEERAQERESKEKHTGGADSEDKENVEGGGGHKDKAKYTGPALITLARAVIDVEPFLSSQGQKGAAWQEVVDTIKKSKHFRNTTVSAASAQNKAEKMVMFKKKPNASKNKKLNNIIGEGTSDGVIIGALLERVEKQFDDAKGKSDAAKAKIKQKNDEDREGGNAIREASMKTFRKRRRDASPPVDKHRRDASPPIDVDVDAAANGTDTEGVVPSTPTPRATAAASSLETLDSDNDDDSGDTPKPKRRRHNASSDAAGFLALMKQESERRAKHDEKIERSFNEFVDNNKQQKDEYISLLRDLISKDKL